MTTVPLTPRERQIAMHNLLWELSRLKRLRSTPERRAIIHDRRRQLTDPEAAE